MTIKSVPRSTHAHSADDPRHQAGEYGEGAPEQTTGVGPRNADAGDQRLDDRPGYADNYGNVEAGRYGAHGYSSQPGHPSAYTQESRVDAGGDQQLRQLICQRLTEDPEIHAADVHIEVSEGTVTLLGRVADARARELIEQVVENCGAKVLRDQLTVG